MFMPRVLRILNRLIVGGPLLNASYLTKYMEPDFETMLVVGEKEAHEKDAGYFTDQLGIQPVYVPEMSRSISPFKDYGAYQKIKKIIRDFKPDIVHTHAAKPGAIGRMAAAAMKVPVIVHTYHGHVFHSYFSSAKTKAFINIERYLGKKSSAIIAISEQQHKELVQDFRIAPANKFRIVPLGLDLDKFANGHEDKRKAFRSSYNIDEDTIVITITGRMVPVKNHDLFLTGLQYVLQHSGKKVKAFIVGDGETRVAMEAKAGSLGIGFSTEKDTVQDQPLVFTSWRSDIDVINAGSDIITLTSFNEGTPVSLIEAHAAGKPVVSTRVGGIEAVVEENSTGLLSDINDSGAYCRNLLEMVSNEKLRDGFGSAAAQKVKEKYSYQRLVKDMKGLYWELLGNKGVKG
jgi:glycosyltransferase involved in cell wall biosynthesis